MTKWTHRFCLPPAAKPSSVWRSATSELNLSAAARAPVKLDAIRAGVTDLGSTTIPLATKHFHYYHDESQQKETYEDNQVKYLRVAAHTLSQSEQQRRRSKVES